MTRQELRVTLDWFCGCGDPEAAAEELLALLRAHPLHTDERWKKLEDDLGTGRFHLILYMLDHLGYTEHGGVVGGGWLSDRGKEIMAALEAEEDDDFESLFPDHGYCVHGYGMDELSDHDCIAMCRAEEGRA